MDATKGLRHTPGPWKAEWTHREGYHESEIRGWHVFRETADDDGSVICDIPDDGNNRQANARLIAKTPEMLAVLREIHRYGLTDEAKGKIAELLAEVD